MPEAHRDFAEWNDERFRKWAKVVDPAYAGAIGTILPSRAIGQQSCRSCRAVMALADKHRRQELEQTCAKALSRTEPQDRQVDHRQGRRAARGEPGCQRVPARERLLNQPRGRRRHAMGTS